MKSTRRRFARACQPSLRLESHWPPSETVNYTQAAHTQALSNTVLGDADTFNNMLAKADAMAAYTRHLHESAEINNAIQFGRLAIEAGLGRVMVSHQGKGGGRGKKKNAETSVPEGPKFTPKTLKTCRRIHKNTEQLPQYESDIKTHNESLADDSPDAIQASTAGFIRFATGTEKAGTAAHVSENTGIPEWYTPDEYLDAAHSATWRDVGDGERRGDAGGEGEAGQTNAARCRN